MYGIKREKAELREKYRKLRAGMPRDLKSAYEAALCRNFINSASYKYYDTVLLYAATDEEIDVSDIARQALSDGKRVAYPRCIPDARGLDFHFVDSLDRLAPGYYGIKEPPEEGPVFDTDEKCCAVCLIPGVVFDRSGYRIGYGGGYYDRFISRFTGTLSGVVFSGFIADSVPHGKFDMRADTLITEEGAVRIDKKD